MWDYTMFPEEKELLSKLGKYSSIAGIILSLVGIGAFAYPLYASIITVAFVAWMMMFAGFTTGYFTYKSNKEDWLGWLKTLILIGTAIFILLDPAMGIETVGLLFAIYFFIDGFTGFALSSSMYPAKGWWIWFFNAIVSIALGIFFLISWQSISQEAWLIGIYIGISLFFDGISLLFMGGHIRNKL